MSILCNRAYRERQRILNILGVDGSEDTRRALDDLLDETATENFAQGRDYRGED